MDLFMPAERVLYDRPTSSPMRRRDYAFEVAEGTGSTWAKCCTPTSP
ncbi:MAG: hypothetical protein ACLT98_00490 [Eggerthellaceae bacterium]